MAGRAARKAKVTSCILEGPDIVDARQLLVTVMFSTVNSTLLSIEEVTAENFSTSVAGSLPTSFYIRVSRTHAEMFFASGDRWHLSSTRLAEWERRARCERCRC